MGNYRRFEYNSPTSLPVFPELVYPVAELTYPALERNEAVLFQSFSC
ncbi:MAG: hypothetical protein ACI9BO_002179 [Zhongshania sp.]|jgi:hypothetical protein